MTILTKYAIVSIARREIINLSVSHPVSSAEEHLVYTQWVGGSNPSPGTMTLWHHRVMITLRCTGNRARGGRYNLMLSLSSSIWLEHPALNRRVVGSSPTGGTMAKATDGFIA